MSVSVHPAGQGAEGGTPHLVRNTSRLPLKYLVNSWERGAYLKIKQVEELTGRGFGFTCRLGKIPIFKTRPGLVSL